MRVILALMLAGCVAPDDGASTWAPPAPTLVMQGDDLFIAGPAERATVAVDGDRFVIAFEHGGSGVQTAKFSMFDLDLTPIVLRSRLSAERSNHVQVAPSPWGWTLSWVRTGHTRLGIRAIDRDGNPRGTDLTLRSSQRFELDYPDMHVDGQGRGLAIWSEEDAQGFTRYGLRRLDATGAAPVEYRMEALDTRGGPPAVCGSEDARLIGWQAKTRSHSTMTVQVVDPDGMEMHPAVLMDQSLESLSRPACVHVDGGGWVVGWRSMDRRGVHLGSFIRFLEEDGTPRGPVQVVDPLGEGLALSIVGDDLVVAWRDYDAHEGGISAQLWSVAAQVATSPVARVNLEEFGTQSSVDVAMWNDGGQLRGVMTWHLGTLPLQRSVWARAFEVVF